MDDLNWEFLWRVDDQNAFMDACGEEQKAEMKFGKIA
jgi:hypothetical protein